MQSAQELKVAFNSIWAQAGMLLSAVGIFSVLARISQLPLSEIVEIVLTTYRHVFHPVADLLSQLFALHLTEGQKDILVIWLAVMGIVTRSVYIANSRYEKYTEHEGAGLRDGTLDHIEYSSGGPIEGWRGALLAAALGILTPIGLLFIFWRAKLILTFVGVNYKWREDRPAEAPVEYEYPRRSIVVADMRLVMAFQTLAMAAVVVGFVLVNLFTG